jgi:hypothetical protein
MKRKRIPCEQESLGRPVRPTWPFDDLTGDSDLDRLLETAREKFLNRSLDVRKEGLRNYGTPGSV